MSFIDLFRVNKIKAENTSLQSRVTELENKLSELGFTEFIPMWMTSCYTYSCSWQTAS